MYVSSLVLLIRKPGGSQVVVSATFFLLLRLLLLPHYCNCLVILKPQVWSQLIGVILRWQWRLSEDTDAVNDVRFDGPNMVEFDLHTILLDFCSTKALVDGLYKNIRSVANILMVLMCENPMTPLYCGVSLWWSHWCQNTVVNVCRSNFTPY